MNSLSKISFLRDVFICSLGAYGGPEAHISVFMEQMVTRQNYLTEEELTELLALCSILPGPTSTQVIASIGYKKGGPILAFLTLLVWAAPVLILMTGLSFTYAILAKTQVSADILKFIGPMAVGFIILAAWRIGKKVITDKITLILMLFGAVSTYFIRSPWIFPLVLAAGGFTSIIFSREKNIWNKTDISPPWRYLFIFVFLGFGSIALAVSTQLQFIELFEKFYRYGYLVFGGGQVLVPVMHSELVHLKGYMTNEEFLTGYGLVQGLPGPMFSFAAYAGGMAARNGGVLQQILGAAAGGTGIFLPGVLLIFFIYPVWESVKKIRAVKISLKGINAVAGGMIAAAAVILIQANGFNPPSLSMTVVSIIILASKKIPAPFLVVIAICAGIIF